MISSDLAPERNASTFGPAVEPPVKLTGFYADDERLPDDLYLRVEDPDSGKTKELRVIGVLESSASFAGQVVTSQKTLEGLAGGPVPPQAYYFDLRSGANAAATADAWRRTSPITACRRRSLPRSSGTATRRGGSSSCS